MLQAEEGKWIIVEYERKGIKQKTEFQLKKLL
jgi:hypothetical protein